MAIPGTTYYRNVNRFPEAKRSQEYMIIRFDNQLYFGNAGFFKDAIQSYVSKRDVIPKFLILDNTNMHDMDSTGLHVFEDIHEYLEGQGIQLLIAGTIGPVRDFLKRSGFTDKLGKNYHYLNISDAVAHAEHRTLQQKSREVAVQFNEKRRSFLD